MAFKSKGIYQVFDTWSSRGSLQGGQMKLLGAETTLAAAKRLVQDPGKWVQEGVTQPDGSIVWSWYASNKDVKIVLVS